MAQHYELRYQVRLTKLVVSLHTDDIFRRYASRIFAAYLHTSLLVKRFILSGTANLRVSNTN